MPRKAKHGGTRQGAPGKTYGQRTDLNGGKVMEFTGQQYGERARQVASQQAVPAQAPPGPSTSGPGANPAPPGPPLGPDPGTLGGLLDPTARPDEPISHGMPFGEGPGPDPMAAQSAGDPDVDNLRAIYRAHPSQALLNLIADMEHM